MLSSCSRNNQIFTQYKRFIQYNAPVDHLSRFIDPYNTTPKRAVTKNNVQYVSLYIIYPKVKCYVMHLFKRMKYLSFSVGPTERSFLANIEDIVNSGLAIDKLVSYITIPAAEDYLLKKIGFCEEIMKVK